MYNDEWNFTVHIEVAVDQGHICVSQVTIAISIGLVEEEVSLTSVSKLIQSQPIVLKLRSRHFLVICEIKKPRSSLSRTSIFVWPIICHERQFMHSLTTYGQYQRQERCCRPHCGQGSHWGHGQLFRIKCILFVVLSRHNWKTKSTYM